MSHSASKVSEKFQITWKKVDTFSYGKICIAYHFKVYNLVSLSSFMMLYSHHHGQVPGNSFAIVNLTMKQFPTGISFNFGVSREYIWKYSSNLDLSF